MRHSGEEPKLRPFAILDHVIKHHPALVQDFKQIIQTGDQRGLVRELCGDGNAVFPKRRVGVVAMGCVRAIGDPEAVQDIANVIHGRCARDDLAGFAVNARIAVEDNEFGGAQVGV